ncbi:MAG: hypothetical protein AABY86_10245 [Bdellovibrionota bacterium]
MFDNDVDGKVGGKKSDNPLYPVAILLSILNANGEFDPLFVPLVVATVLATLGDRKKPRDSKV